MQDDHDRASPLQLIATAVLFGVVGAALGVAPRWALSLVGFGAEGNALLLARVVGAALVGMGVIAAGARAAPRPGRRAVHQGLAAFLLLASVLLLTALLAATVNLWGWVVLAVVIPLFASHAGSGLGSAPRPRTGDE